MIRPDDELPEADLAALAKRHGYDVPAKRIRLLRHGHDSTMGLELEVGKRVPDYYDTRGHRGAIVVGILCNDIGYCAVVRRQDKDTLIYVKLSAVELIEFVNERP